MLISNDSGTDDVFSSCVLGNSVLSYAGIHTGIILLEIKRGNKTPILSLSWTCEKHYFKFPSQGQVKSIFLMRKNMDYFHIKEMLKQVGIIKEAEHQKPTKTTEPILILVQSSYEIYVFLSLYYQDRFRRY